MNESEKVLELDEILSRASAFASSARAKTYITEISPWVDYDEVLARLIFTRQAEYIMTQYRYGGIEPFDDLDEILEKVRAGATLSAADLLRVATVLRSARLAKSGLDEVAGDTDKIRDIAFRIFYDPTLEEDIRRCILSETEISDAASDRLAEIRRDLKRSKAKLIDKLSSFTKSNTYSDFLQDNFYTVRAGRFVLPVKSECRSRVPGLLHDQSASGSTSYIEPFEVVSMNNDIVRLEGDELREIERILQEFSARVYAQRDNLSDAQERLTLLDAYFALAGYSVSIDGIMPQINRAERVRLLGARHPLIDPKRVVPIDISVGTEDGNILLISGPNTGGKTVSLKTIGLLSLMLSVGLLIPCKPGSEMAVFDRIYCDIGDDQNISRNLSTFSSHIMNLKEITESFTNESLILLDEIGSCTAPEEGAAIAVGVIEYISATKAKAVITTHYPQLKEYAMSAAKIQNAGMQFDAQTLRPTYRLLMGLPGTSNAVETAAVLGLAPTIVETAKKRLRYDAEDNYELVLKKAFALKTEAEMTLERAEAEKAEIERRLEKIAADEQKIAETLARINANAKAESKKVVNRVAEKAEDIIREIQAELREADERALLQAKKDLKRIEALAYDNGEELQSVLTEELHEDEIRVGATVVVTSFGLEGVVRKVRKEKKEAEIDCNGKLLKVKFDDLAKPMRRVEREMPRRAPLVPSPSADSVPVGREIMLIGKTVSEAVDVLEPILDESERLHLKELRIVHGKGSGALGKGIQSFLASHPAVKSYRYGRYGEGDFGVTIVELK